MRDIASDVLRIARKGLVARARHDARGRDEACYLDVLYDVVSGGTQAEHLIAAFEDRWKGSVDPAFDECVY